MVIFAEIGDVSLQASRESIDYSQKTKHYLQNRIKNIEQEIIEQVTSKIDNISSELEARKFYKNIFTELGSLGALGSIVKTAVSVTWNKSLISEEFFRLPKAIKAYYGVFRNDRSYTPRTRIEETTVLEYIKTLELHKTNSINRFFYDIQATKTGRLKNMTRQYLGQHGLLVGDGIYIIQVKSLEILRFYCFEKGLDFSLFKDVHKEIVLPKRVRDPNRPPVTNCKAYDPDGIIEDDDIEHDDGYGYKSITIDFGDDEAIEGKFYCVRYYGVNYVDFGMNEQTKIKLFHAFLKEFDPEFKKHPVIYTFAPKYEDKVK
jgi:hypothetical protein